ncbi:MAG: phosphatidylglycerol lysyltransferase domain-containing protein [Planctomycetota bacterium]
MSSERIENAFREYGHDALAVAALDRDYDLFEGAGGSIVPYAKVSRARLAITSPLAPIERWPEVASAFVESASEAGLRAAFFGVERPERFGSGFRSVLIGQQPAWDPALWSEVVASDANLREQLRRAEKKQVEILRLDPDELRSDSDRIRQWQELVDDWLRSRRMAPMKFVVQPRGLTAPDDRELFLALRNDELLGFLCTSRLPARNVIAIGDVFRQRLAPNGTIARLHDHAIRRVGELGAESVTAGLVPLAGPVHPSLRLARSLGRPLFDFRGLQTFRSRLRPQRWEPVYLLHPAGSSPVPAMRDCLRAFAGGSFLRFGVQTIGHRMRRRRSVS